MYQQHEFRTEGGSPAEWLTEKCVYHIFCFLDFVIDTYQCQLYLLVYIVSFSKHCNLSVSALTVKILSLFLKNQP